MTTILTDAEVRTEMAKLEAYLSAAWPMVRGDTAVAVAIRLIDELAAA